MISQYENKVEMISRELERLNGVVENKNSQIRDLEGKASEGDNLARQFAKIKDDFRKITG